MRARLWILAASTVGLASCAGGPATPAGLAYGLPDPASFTYESGDSATWNIDAGGQSFQMTINSSSTMAASFARAPDGVQVTLTPEAFSGRLSQPMGAPVTADFADFDGELVFTLDRQGNAAVVSEPTVRDGANLFYGAHATAHSFFPRLPGRAVEIGDTWTDTIRFESAQGPGRISAEYITTYVVAGDTMFEGRNVVRLDLSGTVARDEEATVGTTQVAVSATGAVAGHVLWDMRRSVMAERYLEEDLRGSLVVSLAPFPLTVNIRARSRSVLQD